MASHSQQRSDRLVIGITGRIGAGKTSVARYLSSVHGFYYIRYSQVLSDWQAKDPESKAHLQVVGWKVMGGGMQAELNSRLISLIPQRQDCAVDGLRHPIDYDSLSKTFGSGFRLFYVESSLETRWHRLQVRFPNQNDFRESDSHPVEQQIDALRDRAFVVLENNISLEELYSKVGAALNKIRPGGQR